MDPACLPSFLHSSLSLRDQDVEPRGQLESQRPIAKENQGINLSESPGGGAMGCFFRLLQQDPMTR